VSGETRAARRATHRLLLVVLPATRISAEDLPKLFDRYYRTASARSGSARGLGMGLYIAKGLIEAHGGRIWAEFPVRPDNVSVRASGDARGSVALIDNCAFGARPPSGEAHSTEPRATSSGRGTRYRGRPFSREQLRGSGDELREVERLAQQPGVLAERAYLRRDALVGQRGYEDD
jgi:Histidine kinase-, DNA gyrase B-, and HSP90-like ATPase